MSPIGLKSIEYNPELSKDEYLNQGYKEVEIGIAPDRAHLLVNNTQAKRKQYRLKHHVTSSIHVAMGDSLQSMATEISRQNTNFKMWDKGQMIIILSRTKLAKETIFVGDKNDTLTALRLLLTRRI